VDWLIEDTLDSEVKSEGSALTPWKVVIVDDDPQMHHVTKIAINDFEFEGRKLNLVYIYNGNDAKEYFAQHNDIALVLLDVVMESDHAGLEVVKYIRDELENHYTRIILRTGQPGNAPEHEVIRSYDIDGYVSKTQTTIQLLHHTIYIALRSYRDLIRLQHYLKGLEAIIGSICNLTQIDDVLALSNAVLGQIKNVLNAESTQFLIKDSEAYSVVKAKNHTWNISMEENTAFFIDDNDISKSNSHLYTVIKSALEQQQSIIAPPYYCHYFQSLKGSENIFIIKHNNKLKQSSLRLIKLFSMNIALTIEHLLLKQNKEA